MRHRSHKNSTALSKYVWSLKDKNTDFNIRWSVRRRATAYQNTTRMCNLCLAEKLEIIKADKKRSLNKRTELVSNVDTRTASTSVISRRLCHERFPYVLFLPIFQIADFSILSNFSNYFRPFLILPLFFEFFEFFPVYNYALFIVFCFSFFLSSPNFMLVLCRPPMFSTLYLPAGFCQFSAPKLYFVQPPFFPGPSGPHFYPRFWGFCSLSTWGSAETLSRETPSSAMKM